MSNPRREAWREVDASGNADDMIVYLDPAAAATAALRAESLALLELSVGATVLDAGCGTGVAAVELADLVGSSGRVHAIDPSVAMVACTEARWLSNSGGTSRRHPSARPVRGLLRRRAHRTRRRSTSHSMSANARSKNLSALSAPADGSRWWRRVTFNAGSTATTSSCPAPQAWLPTRLRVSICALGLLSAGCREVVSHPRPVAFSSIADLRPVARLEVLARAASKAGATEAEVETTLAELDRRDREGTFFAVMMFYVAAGTVVA